MKTAITILVLWIMAEVIGFTIGWDAVLVYAKGMSALEIAGTIAILILARLTLKHRQIVWFLFIYKVSQITTGRRNPMA